MEWKHTKVQGGGDKYLLLERGVALATIVRRPGTVARVYWIDGTTTDYRTIATAKRAALRNV